MAEESTKMRGGAGAGRTLKRDFSMLVDRDVDVRLPEGVSAQPAVFARPLPLPLPVCGDEAASSMEPPLLPPPWKRERSGGALCPRPVATPAVAPQRLERQLTPRVSWSGLSRQASQESGPARLLRHLSCSQELFGSQEDPLDAAPCGSPPRTPQTPSTPVLSCLRAPPSPPEHLKPWRRRPASYEDIGESLADQNEGRLSREFCEVTQIGRGQFSTVFRVRNRVDQCLYAVKRTNQVVRGNQSQSQLREVFALASVAIEAAGCQHIVRYYSSWLEDGRLHIQTELCEGSLRDYLARLSRDSQTKEPFDPRADAGVVAKVLLHVSSGLAVLHARNFVHLDIKPDNILLARDCYKIADLGLAAAAIDAGCDDVSEGDCRYLAREVLRGDFSNLPKADVFALGLVAYELATNPLPLPLNGEQWQKLRSGVLDDGRISPEFPGGLFRLMQAMVSELPIERPDCEAIVRHACVAPSQKTAEAPASLVEELQEQMRQRTREAEKAHREAEQARERAHQETQRADAETQRADAYWREILLMKKQELSQQRGPAQSLACSGSSGSGLVATHLRSPRKGGACQSSPTIQRMHTM
eukprot:TRINITY_DN72507_c0_g1_i1.p1 TRINITY_DN72507_c0_g1~~TRINITY_DN72507_c0_g1_i1.p1  ORF type:complete len:586 (+),score=89.15 TRINITY_DN72507_c0_g1_i1:98-1855(+)